METAKAYHERMRMMQEKVVEHARLRDLSRLEHFAVNYTENAAFSATLARSSATGKRPRSVSTPLIEWANILGRGLVQVQVEAAYANVVHRGDCAATAMESFASRSTFDACIARVEKEAAAFDAAVAAFVHSKDSETQLDGRFTEILDALPRRTHATLIKSTLAHIKTFPKRLKDAEKKEKARLANLALLSNEAKRGRSTTCATVLRSSTL